MMKMIRLLAIQLILIVALDHTSGLLRGYRNSRTWGTGRQGRVSKTFSRARMGRQQLDISNDVAQIENRCNECTILDIESGVVCATDGKNYQNMCQLKQTSCKLLRRQGRSFQSSQLALEVSHTGPCKSPCPGMESLGQFQAFGVRATNFGLCVHDFFNCAGVMKNSGLDQVQSQRCCQQRFDQCYSG